MSDAGTVKMLRRYEEGVQAPMFLTGFFRTPPENFHRSEKVEIDVIRNDPNIAVPIADVGAGARQVSLKLYTNKGYTPPVYDNESTISAYTTMKRQPGDDPFQDPNFVGAASSEAMRHMRHLEAIIRRAVEVQASQVLSSGTITLVDSAGTTIFSEDFQPKASHFTTTSNTWGGGSDDPLADLGSLAEEIRKDGKVNPNILVFGRTAWNAFRQNPEVKAQLDNRRIEAGGITRPSRGMGGTRFGTVVVDTYEFEIWVYNDTYIHPNTGNHTPFVDPTHVLMLSDQTRLDLTFGALPTFMPPQARAVQFLPGRFSFGGDRAMDLTANTWVTPDGKHLKISVGTRPLCLPTAIDGFGRLDTTV